VRGEFERETGCRIGNSLLRDSFVTHVCAGDVSDRLKHTLAEHMGHCIHSIQLPNECTHLNCPAEMRGFLLFFRVRIERMQDCKTTIPPSPSVCCFPSIRLFCTIHFPVRNNNNSSGVSTDNSGDTPLITLF
jgi:hypothetical protein